MIDAELARIWDAEFVRVIHVQAEGGKLILVLPDGEVMRLALTQVQNLRRALQRYETAAKEEAGE